MERRRAADEPLRGPTRLHAPAAISKVFAAGLAPKANNPSDLSSGRTRTVFYWTVCCREVFQGEHDVSHARGRMTFGATAL
jgi:hypothetical protein